MQPCVQTAGGQQVFVGTALGDVAAVEHEDGVGLSDGGEAVGNDDHRAAHHQVGQRVLHQHLRLRIEGRSGLVEDQDRAGSQQGAGDGDALALAHREEVPPFADHRVVAPGKFTDKIVGKGRPGRRLHLLHTDVHPAIGDVVPHRLVEEDDLLGDQGDLVPQRLHLQRPDIPAIHFQHPAGDVEEPRDQVDQGGLPRPAATHQGHHFSPIHGEVDPVQHCLVLVGEGNVPETDLGGERLQRRGVRAVLHRHLHVDHGKNPFGRGQGLLQAVVDPAEPLDDHVGVGQRPEEGEQHARGEGAGLDARTGIDDQYHPPHGPHQFHHRRGEGQHLDPLDVHLEHPLQGRGKTGDLVVLHVEPGDHPRPGNGLVDPAGDLGHPLLGRVRDPLHPLAETDHRVDHQRHQHTADQRQLPVEVEHQEDLAKEDQAVLHDVGELPGGGLLQAVDVVGHP